MKPDISDYQKAIERNITSNTSDYAIIKMQQDENRFNVAESKLYLCNCDNQSSRIDPSWHHYKCYYKTWYENYFKEKQEC